MKFVDVGQPFGFGTSRIFNPWADVEFLDYDTVGAIRQNADIIDLIIFGGGSDIHPSIYGQANIASHASDFPSFRDLFEIEVWKIAQRMKIPVLGICRGSQMVCALSGGHLIQDVMGHGYETAPGGHFIHTDDGRKLDMSTAHHQMMYPWTTKHRLIAWCKTHENQRYHLDTKALDFKRPDVDPEVVYFPETKALAVQGHPEYFRDVECDSVAAVRQWVNQYLLAEQPN